MSRTSPPPRRKSPLDRERAELRKRVGAYVRSRRETLGLSQGDIIRELGYVSRNSVSNIETGREGLPAKRVYAWADVLEVPRDAFFRFVTGETKKLETNGEAKASSSTLDHELLAAFRALPAKHQKRVRELVKELSGQAKRA